MSLRIRCFKKTDAKRASRLIRQALTRINSEDYPNYVIKGLIKHYSARSLIGAARSATCLVAVSRGRILGTASLAGNRISAVFVDPAMTGRGVGSKLVAEIEAIARRKGYRVVTLTSSITALSFYLIRGYNVSKKSQSLRSGILFQMSKRLSQSGVIIINRPEN